jgi:acyl-CoA hydrolase/GNAT superfamily N-acetyltransferase
MTAWKERYAHKIGTAADAIRKIPRGRRILIGSGAGEPGALVEALVTNGDHLENNEIVHLLTLGPAPYVKAGLERRFRHTAFFIGENVREAVHQGRADFMPVFLSDIPRLIAARRVRIDVALVQVSPPDAHGYVSLGVSVDIVRAALDAADIVLAEVNPRMPRTHGDSFLHVDRIDMLVPVDAPLPQRLGEELDEVDRAIGRNVARLVPNGATLQMGIGKIPDAVLASLDDREDLGVHTEMFSDGVMRLANLGVINGRKKTLLPGKIVTSFIMGSTGLYEWVNDNPAIEMRPSSFSNDPEVIARNDHMIAINSALAVDLTGQVAADTLMGRFFSGIGGQVDFIRGASRSEGGKPVIALRSTAKNNTVSRIRAVFEEGAGIVTSRGDVHYVVTEHGIADLWGKSVRQRTLALIDIAHPDFRGELLDAAKARRYVFPDQTIPRGAIDDCDERAVAIEDGSSVNVRTVRISDETELRDLFYRLADGSTADRFLVSFVRLASLQDDGDLALVATVSNGDHDEIIGIGRYDLDPATNNADIAVVVQDAWQNRGVGPALLRRLAEIARARGVVGFTARLPAGHRGLARVFDKCGLVFTLTPVGPELQLTAPLAKPTAPPPPRTSMLPTSRT